MTLLSGATPPWDDPTDDTGTGTDGTVFDLAFWENQRDAIDNLIHSLTNPTETPADIIDEVVAARGSEASLDARLDVTLNADGSFIDPIVQKIDADVTAMANVGTAETDLITFALPAGKLAATGEAIRVRAWGITGANGNTKTFKAYFGATALAFGTTTGNGLHWHAEFIVVRTGATSQLMSGVLVCNGEAMRVINASPAETLSGSVTVKMTGQSDTASNDVIQYGMITEFLG